MLLAALCLLSLSCSCRAFLLGGPALGSGRSRIVHTRPRMAGDSDADKALHEAPGKILDQIVDGAVVYYLEPHKEAENIHKYRLEIEVRGEKTKGELLLAASAPFVFSCSLQFCAAGPNYCSHV
jgi:hypothetical protein